MLDRLKSDGAWYDVHANLGRQRGPFAFFTRSFGSRKRLRGKRRTDHWSQKPGPWRKRIAPPVIVHPEAPNATITADPNPIRVCDGSGFGVATIGFSFKPPVSVVEIRVDSPDGQLFALKDASGSQTTGKWVTDGTVFYLQDVTGGRPLLPEHTLATVTVRLTTEGCPD